MNELLFTRILLSVCLVVTIQGILTLKQMLHGWFSPNSLDSNDLPHKHLPSKESFSILIACRNEERVIGNTLNCIGKMDYPSHLFEVILAVSETDTQTILEIKKGILKNKNINIKLIVFPDPIRPSKPYSLNQVYKKAKGNYLAIFDAEDELNPNLLSQVNDVIANEGEHIIQTGARLMNWSSKWFGIHSALEYYQWFNSRLQWHVDNKVAPLGGIGVFFPKRIIEALGGWDEKSLTEDAKIGIDCSLANMKFRVIASEALSTKEEVTNSLSQFVRQRTRWIHGFLQIFLDGDWLNFSLKRKMYFLSLFLFPFFQVILSFWFVVTMLVAPRLPLLVVMASFVPLAILVFQMIISCACIVEMLIIRKEFIKIPFAVCIYILTFVPYQLIISFSAIRAFIRCLKGTVNWEKTGHYNLHRSYI